MVTLTQFLSFFKSYNSITFDAFIKKAQVKVDTKLYPLTEYIKRKNIPLADIKIVFANIQHRNEYLTRFYNTSLRLPDTLAITESPMKFTNMNNNIELHYKNVIRNMFWLEILKNTKSGIENNPTYIDVLINLYKHHIIDYKILTPSVIQYVKNGRIGSVFSSFYFRASIMNPYLVYSLNKNVLQGSRIFTPTLGWGSYFYGFAESGIDEYVGVDVIPTVCKQVTLFSKENYPSIESKYYCTPSEKLAVNDAFLNKYKTHFDVVFFSPPYFNLELYEGSQQSTSKYHNYEVWLEKYWRATIKLCHHVLQKNGRLCYILSGYGSDNVNEKYDLLKDMNAITSEYFKLKKIAPMYNKVVHTTTAREPREKIMLFIKE